MSSLQSDHMSYIWIENGEKKFSFGIDLLLDDEVLSMNEIIRGSIFILWTAHAMYCIYICNNMYRNRISCFDQDIIGVY